MKRLRNTSGIPDETVRGIVNWIVEELGISAFDVECRASDSTVAGRAYIHGSGYHSTARPFVVLRVGKENIISYDVRLNDGRILQMAKRPPRWWSRASAEGVRTGVSTTKILRNRFPCFIRPYQYAQHKGKRYWLATRTEALVYVAAHELRHLWQAAQHSDKRKSKPLPRFPGGGRGKLSEIDTEAFAIHMLREWRRIPENEKREA